MILSVAYQVACYHNYSDALYFLEVYNWMNRKYGYVMDYSLTFIPSIYEKH